MSYILSGLYLSDYETASDPRWITANHVTHILSVDAKPLPLDTYEGLQYKYVYALDMNSTYLLQHFNECITFIQSAREQGGTVLVHCTYGQSRSATVVLAYVMKALAMTCEDAMTLVMKLKPDIKPNPSFQKQLELFESTEYLSILTDEYKMFRLKSLSERIQGANFNRELLQDTSLLDDPDVDDGSEVESVYKCRKCRRLLFTGKSVLPHDDHMVLLKEGREATCTHSIFIAPMRWMESMILSGEGKVNCPKCVAKLGSFKWSGSKCACGRWITPSFHFHPGKVDRTKITSLT